MIRGCDHPISSPPPGGRQREEHVEGHSSKTAQQTEAGRCLLLKRVWHTLSARCVALFCHPSTDRLCLSYACKAPHPGSVHCTHPAHYASWYLSKREEQESIVFCLQLLHVVPNANQSTASSCTDCLIASMCHAMGPYGAGISSQWGYHLVHLCLRWLLN